VLAVLGMELEMVVAGHSGTLDDLRRERNAPGTGSARGRS
jgi:hypothetical protein